MTANKWKQELKLIKIDKCRTGWVGVWDAIKQAITGQPRLVVPCELAITLSVDMPEGATFRVTGVTMGERDD